MDDQFLHQLRRDPPAQFAHQLKRQLDRLAESRPAASRLLVGMAIFSTAFALVTPPVRHTLADFFISSANQTSQADERSVHDIPAAAKPADLSRRDADSLHGGVLPHNSAISSPATRAWASSSPRNLTAMEAGAAGASAVAAMPNAPVFVAPVPPTLRVQAESVAATRKGLFSVLAWILRPLLPMLHGEGQFDAKAAGAGGERIQQLATMIPEVFSFDTRPFDVNTRAKDNIWTQADDFHLKADDLIDAANALVRAATARDKQAAAKAADAIEAACDACHAVYMHNETELTRGATER